MSTPHSQTKFPPAAVLALQLSAPGEPPSDTTLTALIDTGADFTIVPLQWLLDIQAPEARAAYVRGMWSGRQLITLYLVDIHLAYGTLPGMEVIGIDSEDEEQEVILGRNVLNLLILLLDGPQQQSTILERRPRRF
jgi:predicted aspartyl protease